MRQSKAKTTEKSMKTRNKAVSKDELVPDEEVREKVKNLKGGEAQMERKKEAKMRTRRGDGRVPAPVAAG